MKTIIQASRGRRGVRSPTGARINRRNGRAWRAAAVAMTVGCAAASAHAESFFAIEAGLGFTHATREGDGMYFNEGFSHSTPTNSFGARGGIVFNAIDAQPLSWVPGLRVHLTYAYWGSLKWQATVVDDVNVRADGSLAGYSTASKSCFNNNCGPRRTFYSSGSTHSINLTVEPYWNLGSGWTVGVEAGPSVYWGPWTSDYVSIDPGWAGPPGTVQQVSHRVVPHLGALVGASVSKGPFSVRAQYLFAPPRYISNGTDVPSGIRGVFMVSVNYTY